MTSAQAPVRISVVMPVRDGAATIGEQLAALSRQDTIDPWELVVADNGSRDRTQEVVARWRHRVPRLRCLRATDRPGAAHARNVGARAAEGRLLAFCDADDVVADGWLGGLVAALEEAELVTGPMLTATINPPRAVRWRDPLPTDAPPLSHGFLPYALSANLGVRRDAFDGLGGFREDYPVGEDVELSWRAQLAGMRLGFAPSAGVHYRYRAELRALVRQYLGYGTIGPRLYRDFRAAGMPASTLRASIGPWARLLLALPRCAVDPDVRGDVLRRLAFRAGRVRGSLAAGVVYL